MSAYEYCWICNEPTGRAGRADDSLFDDDDGGPYCEACWGEATSVAEPVYVAQTAEPMTDDERSTWFSARGEDARSKGATWLRMSVYPTHKPIMALVEGWAKRPEDEGQLRWACVMDMDGQC
jgi:hypothetical protein